VLKALPEDQRVLGLVYEPRDAIHTGYPFRHILLLAQVRRRAVMPHSFADDFAPVAREKPALPAFEYSRPGDFTYRRYGRYYDYFLTIAPPGKQPDVTFWRRRRGTAGPRSGRFGLYQNVGSLKPK
jgi:hypothetical protein